MCSSPKAPPPPPPPVRPQEAKPPDVAAIYGNRKKQQGPISGGTLLTGPNGVDTALLNTGKTLLGS
jgi:hypothetical protein